MMKRAGLLVMTLVMAVWSLTALAQVRADVALRAAMEQETVKGDLKGAIDAYKKIVDGYPKERAVQAQALLRMAGCYQKLGDAQADEIYRRVISEFSDQEEPVAIARAKVTQPRRAAGELTIRRLDTTPEWVDAISEDGSKVVFTDWDTGNIVVRELASGRTFPISSQAPGPDGTYSEFGQLPVLSRDGRQVAYTWCTIVQSDCVGYLRIGRAEEGQTASGRLLYGRDVWTTAHDWSPDGKQLAVVIVKEGNLSEIALITVADGSVRTLKVLGRNNGPKRMFFSPDGKHLAFDTANGPPGGQFARGGDVFLLSVSGGTETPVSIDPAHSIVAGWAPDGGRLLFTSDSGGTVDLYAVPVVNGRPQGRAVVVKSDLSAVTPLSLNRSGALFYSVDAGGGTHVEQAAIDFRTGSVSTPPSQVMELALGTTTQPEWSADGQWLAYVYRRSSTPHARSSIMIRSTVSGDVREVRPDLTTIGRLRWSTDGRLLYAMGADGRGGAGLFSIDVRTGGTSLLAAGDTLRHLRLNKAGTHAQFYRSARGRHSFVQFDLAKATETELFAFEAPGAPAAAEISPDESTAFYRRRLATVAGAPAMRVVVERDLASGRERELLKGHMNRSMLLAPDGKHIAFWRGDPAGKWSAVSVAPTTGDPSIRDLIRIEQPGGLNLAAWAPDGRSVLINRSSPAPSERVTWWAPLDGSAPRKLDHFLGNIRVHPDGRRVAFEVGSGDSRRSEIWAMEHFLPAPPKKSGSPQ